LFILERARREQNYLASCPRALSCARWTFSPLHKDGLPLR